MVLQLEQTTSRFVKLKLVYLFTYTWLVLNACRNTKTFFLHSYSLRFMSYLTNGMLCLYVVYFVYVVRFIKLKDILKTLEVKVFYLGKQKGILLVVSMLLLPEYFFSFDLLKLCLLTIKGRKWGVYCIYTLFYRMIRNGKARGACKFSDMFLNFLTPTDPPTNHHCVEDFLTSILSL